MESRQSKQTENTSEYKMKLMNHHNGAEAGATGLLPEFESAGISMSSPASHEERMKGNSDVIVAVLNEMEPPTRVTSASAQILATGLNPSEGMFHLFFSYRAAARDFI